MSSHGNGAGSTELTFLGFTLAPWQVYVLRLWGIDVDALLEVFGFDEEVSDDGLQHPDLPQQGVQGRAVPVPPAAQGEAG